MHISKEEARIHNLIIRFAKNKELLDTGKLSRADLTDKLFFRAEDFKIAIDGNILRGENDFFFPTDYLKGEVDRLLGNTIKDGQELDSLKNEYLSKFDDLNESGSYRPTRELINLASKIHWHVLPEYEEYMIVNSELYPNKDTQEYYNHFHTLEDLYKELTGEGKKVESKKGDINLNKEIDIKIYSRRWGHKDTYSVERTLEGWTVTFHQKKAGDKEGKALIETLEHDFINYPHELGVFMWHLWNKADSNEMTVEELEQDLKKIANWINVCEENTPEGIEV